MNGRFYQKRFEDVLTELRVRSDVGLSGREVARRTAADGNNELPHNGRPHMLFQLAERFKDFLVWLLITAGVVSILIGEGADAIIIFIVVAADLLLSFIQVRRAEKTLEKLKAHVQQGALVVRDGRLKKVLATELVVGDIIEFRAGYKIPADARLLSAQGLTVREGALTGESADVSKDTVPLSGKVSLGDRRNMVYLGTVVMAGRGRAVVTAVGAATEFGKIAQLAKEHKTTTTPLQRKLAKTGLKLTAVIVALVGLIAALEIRQGSRWLDAAHVAITLIVSAIPEDLTIILTVALTIGVVRILKKQAIVRKMSSAETLGAATVICTDKTGTLTLGEMTPQELDFTQGETASSNTLASTGNDLRRLAVTTIALASGGSRVAKGKGQYLGSATEKALLAFAEACEVDVAGLRKQWRQRAVLPFDAKYKFRATLNDHPQNAEQTIFVVGAPEELLERSAKTINETHTESDLTSQTRTEITKQIEHRASLGQRLVGVAVRRHVEQSALKLPDVAQLTWLGMVVIADPVRPEVRQAIKESMDSGVAVKIITGDHAATARAVAAEVGLTVNSDNILLGDEVEDMSAEELESAVGKTVIFSRVGPLDKQRIINALQKKKEIVAMTGDGVNDVVALKQADIGVAMGSGKDVARDAADLVLLNNSFATIVAAIKEGRVIRDNVRKVIAFLLATNVAEVGIFLISQVLRLPLPLVPAQILWINLVTDGTSDMALALEPAEENVMKRGPEDPAKPLLHRHVIAQIIYVGMVMTVIAMGLYYYLYVEQQVDLGYARTIVFCFIALSSLLSTWSFKSLKLSMLSRYVFKNKWLFVSAGFSFALQVLAIYWAPLSSFFDTVPLGLWDWVLLLVLSLLALFLFDLRKFFLQFHYGDNR